MGDLDEFERGVKLVIENVSFDRDVVVSVFETNIRVVGGLLAAHTLAELLHDRMNRMSWYQGELLNMALDVGYRLLPAFNSTTGTNPINSFVLFLKTEKRLFYKPLSFLENNY